MRPCSLGVSCGASLSILLAAWAEEDTCRSPGCGADNVHVQGGKQPSRVDWAKFERDGYVVIPQVLTPEQVRQALAARQKWASKGFFKERNVVDSDPIYAQLLESLPQEVEAWLDSVFGPWVFGSIVFRPMYPLPKSQRPTNEEQLRHRVLKMVHVDYPYGWLSCGWFKLKNATECLRDVPRDHHPPLLNIVFMLTPYSRHNGGARVLPGSHKVNFTIPDVIGPETRFQQAVFWERNVEIHGQPGDVALFWGDMLHNQGFNAGEPPQRAILLSVYPYFFKPERGHGYTISNRVARTLSQQTRSRLGLTGYTLFKHTGQSDSGPPRPLQDAALMLSDALCYGYPTLKGGPPFGRWCSLSVLAAPLLLLPGRRFGEALKLLLAVSAGLLLGTSLILEKFQL